jgi:hypothetical protein
LNEEMDSNTRLRAAESLGFDKPYQCPTMSAIGAVISGFPSSEMEKEKLKTRELTGVSGRDLLMAVLDETQGFYTIIILQDQNCRTDACFDYANQYWFWGPLTGTVSHDPIYIQQPRLR